MGKEMFTRYAGQAIAGMSIGWLTLRDGYGGLTAVLSGLVAAGLAHLVLRGVGAITRQPREEQPVDVEIPRWTSIGENRPDRYLAD